ncbi:MAG: hypothetical protein M3511_06175 [Deinococcota bacterium]|nr:hypothetical protein [Deinococcota bacterium]
MAEVIDNYKVIINKGSNIGIYVGLEMIVYEPGEEVFDPNTNESLGEAEIIKGRGKIIHVQEKMALLQLETPVALPKEGNRTLADMVLTASPRGGFSRYNRVEIGDLVKISQTF